MISNTLKTLIFAFLSKCEGIYGKEMCFQESICTNGLHFDRHFTTWGYSEFILKRVGGRISGGRLTWEGEKMYYEVGLDMVIDFRELSENKVEFTEKYSETVFRKTIITF